MRSAIITDCPISNYIDQSAILDLNELLILNCQKCMTCFKTPGYCPYRDDMKKVRDVMQADVVICVTHIRYGSFDELFLKLWERMMAVLSPYYQVDADGQSCHTLLCAPIKKLIIIGYGDMTHEEQDVFERSLSAMPRFYQDLTVYFTTKDELPWTLKMFGGINHG